MLSLASFASCAFLSYLCYRFLLSPCFFSPLAKIPQAHWTASWSPFWILWIRYAQKENQTVHSAHLKHGPIVRLGPNEISISCVKGGIRTVYGGGFEKAAFYPNQFKNYGLVSLFTMTTSKPHSVRKRMISNIYSKSYIQSSQEVTEITRTMLLDRLLPLLDCSSSAKTPVEIHEVNFAVAMDFISSYLFGLSNNSNFIEDVPMRRNFMNWYFKRTENTYWTQEFPRLKRLLDRFGIHLVPAWVDEANTEIEAWVLRLCRLAESSLASFSQSAKTAHQTTPVVYKQLKESLQIPRTRPTNPGDHHPSSPVDLHTASEMLDQLAAGMDTSGVTLTYLFWNLSRNPEVQSSLRKELSSLSPPMHLDSHSLPPARALDTLPLLHAVVMETLRLHSPVPGLQPRITPTIPVSLAGSPPLPAGIRVSAQAYSLHRNPDVFPHPEQWNPRRWLDSTKEQKDEMMRWFWAFSSGGRMCIGSNFAMQELKYVTTAVYTNFSTKIVDDTGIEQLDCYTGGPRGHQLTLSFERA